MSSAEPPTSTSKLEHELKLLVDPQLFSAGAFLSALGTRPGVQVGPAETTRVQDVYLDTRDRALARAGLSARWRRKGRNQSLQVKPVPLLSGLLLERVELHGDLRRGEEPVEALRQLLHKRLGLRLTGRLVPEVELRSLRRVHRLELRAHAGADEPCVAELSFDAVTTLRPGTRGGPHFQELELELVEGSPAPFRGVAAWIADQPGTQPSKQSKHRRALELLGIPVLRLGAPPPRFGPLTTADAVARLTCSAQLQAISDYEAGTRLGLDSEYLHKMRVATRRLRAALRAFGVCFPAGALNALRRELGWLADALGAVRDLDVQLLELPQHQATLGPVPEAGWAELKSQLAARRQRARAELEHVLSSPRYQRLLKTGQELFSHAPRRRASHPGDQPVVEMAAEAVATRAKKLQRTVKACRREPGAEALHQLRIRGKQLRYACEFFGPLYGTEFDEQVARLAVFQDALGRFQDRVVSGGLAEKLRDEALRDRAAGDTVLPAYLYVIGLLVAGGRLGAEGARDELERSYQHVGGNRAIRALAKEARRRAEQVQAALVVTGLPAVSPSS